MRNFIYLLALMILLGACQSEQSEQTPFVTNVEIQDQFLQFSPGDAVTVFAQGFEVDDEILFEVRYAGVGPNNQAEALGVRGIITKKTAESITFLAPGHYPSSTVTVLLQRGGNVMTLGKIKVKDGQPRRGLYGLRQGDDNLTCIDYIDPASGSATLVGKLEPDQHITCAVSAAGSGWIRGINSGSEVGFDVTMDYYTNSAYGSDKYVVAGKMNPASVVCLIGEDQTLVVSAFTRDLLPSQPIWTLPDGITVKNIAPCPFVNNYGYLLLSIDHGDGTFSPMALSLREPYRVILGDRVTADALLPFGLTQSHATDSGGDYLCGYAISKANGGSSEFRICNPETLILGEPFATSPNSVRSLAVDSDAQMSGLYVQFVGSRNGDLICRYDPETKDWILINSGSTYSQIVSGM